MENFFEGYGSLLFLAGIVGFMVWMHSRGKGGCCGSQSHGDDGRGEDHADGILEKARVSDNNSSTRGGSCH